jgi:pimeloyl-ACP methyl ester carboxylesterase
MAWSMAFDHEQGCNFATFAILRPMTKPLNTALKALLVLLATATVTVADTPALRGQCPPATPAPPSAESGRLLILPGVGNTRFHLAGFVERAQAQLPSFTIDVQPWGVPFLMIHNLRAHERNVATAARMAEEITAWRRAHPKEPLYVVGYSGGGGMAMLIAAALPDDMQIDRLILVAPAISPDYPLESEVLPHVRELVVNYSSERDLQVGWGTRTFGTIDRVRTVSAGAVGFDLTHPQLLQYGWSTADEPLGHFGNHIAYLGERWQLAKLLPALDPSLDSSELAAHWASTCKES